MRTNSQSQDRTSRILERTERLLDNAENGQSESQEELEKRIREEVKRDLGIGQRVSGNAPDFSGRDAEPIPESGTGVSVGVDRGRKAEIARESVRLFRAMAFGQAPDVGQALSNLAAVGAYDGSRRDVAAGDAYNLFTDADGAVLIPTVVVREISTILPEFGAIAASARPYPGVKEKLKVSAASGNLVAVAVAEGAAITSKKRSLSAVTMDPEKWALIAPFTYESFTNPHTATALYDDLIRAVAAGFAEAEDNAGLNGDGTAAFHDIEGILNVSGTNEYTLPAGSTSIDDLTFEDTTLLRRQLAPKLRGRGKFIFHRDVEERLMLFQDGNGRYLYDVEANGRGSLRGAEVLYTEALPGVGTASAGDTIGVFADMQKWLVARGEEMSMEELREATIQDADTGDPINLATMDGRALKFRSFWDMKTNHPEAFVKITLAAS